MRVSVLALLASCLLCLGTLNTWAQDVVLNSRDSDIEITGTLLGFDGEFYRVDTVYGELTVDGSGVNCSGPGCPDLENFVARILFSGAPSVGRVLMPALIEAFAIRQDYEVKRKSDGDRSFFYEIFDRDTKALLGVFEFQLNNSNTGLSDLISDRVDVAMSVREVTSQEVIQGKSAGIGDLTGRGRSRIVALDALVPVVAPTNPVQSITTLELSQILAGLVDNWKELGGPNASIAVHVMDQITGLGQATQQEVLDPAKSLLLAAAVQHVNPTSLSEAVAKDPFALGVTSRSEINSAWEISLTGVCGVATNATRRAVKTEDYPLTAPLFLYLPARRYPKILREFLAYTRDPSAQLVIRRDLHMQSRKWVMKCPWIF